MRLLLDTHIVIWLKTDPRRVAPHVHSALRESEAAAVSVVSGWEYGAKRARRPGLFAFTWEQLIEDGPFERLGLDFACHGYAESLPPIHTDPFDRMLIAQALHGGWTLVSADETVRRYPVASLW